MKFTDLLLLLVKLFLRAGTLFSDQELSISVIFSTTLLNGIDLDILGSDIVLKLGDLPVQIFDHLLACLEDLILRVDVRMSSV